MTKDNLLNKEDIKLKAFTIHMFLSLNAKQFASWIDDECLCFRVRFSAG